MTILSTSFTRFDQIGVREDLANIIDNVAPTECPFLMNAGVRKVTNTTFDWQTDTLASAVSTNQQLDGDDLAGAYTAVVPTVKISSYTEIARKTVSVSGTARAVNTAGRADDLNYVVANLGKELKRDMETSLLANKGAVAGNTSTARKTAGLKAYIKTNKDKASDGTAPVYTTVATDVWTDGTQRAFTETITKNVLQQCFTSGADTSTIMVGAFNKQTFSSFSGVVELTNAMGKGQAVIIGAADTYVSDFGRLSVVPNRFMPSRDALFIDWSRVKVCYLRPYRIEEMAKTGDADNRMLLAEYGLMVSNEKGLGIATDLTTS